MDPSPPAFELGALVVWRGQLCVLRGVEPMSVPERRAEVEECQTGERVRPPFAELELSTSTCS